MPYTVYIIILALVIIVVSITVDVIVHSFNSAAVSHN